MHLITFLHPSSKTMQLGVLKKDSIYPFSTAFKSEIPYIYTDMNVFITHHTQEMLESLKQVSKYKPLCTLKNLHASKMKH